MRAPSLLALAFLVACSGSDDGGTVPDGGTDEPTDTGTVDTDTIDTDTTPTGDTGAAPTGDIVLGNPTWTLHPEIGSLVYVQWEQDRAEEVTIEYSFDAGEWHAAPPIAAVVGANERLIAGIPFGTSAEWRIVAETGSLDGPTIATAPPPAQLPIGVVETADPTRWLPEGNYFLTSINSDGGGWTGGDYFTFIIDRKARPVWARPTPQRHWTLFAMVSVAGDHLLWDEQTYWSDFPPNGADSKVHRTYLDQEIEIIDTPGLHHAFVELPDGTLTWGSQYHGGGEALVEKAPGQPDDTVIWTCDDDWPGAGRAPESNGIFYSPLRNTYLYSYYTNSSVVEVDRATGTSLWWAGDVANGYAFDPEWAEFEWQHGISWTDAGTLLLSTEGCLQSEITWLGRCADGTPLTTWVREYDVDEVNGVLTLLWSADSGYTADTNGDAWRLSNGNTLHTVGSAGQVKEYDAAGNDVWHVNFEQNGLRDPLLGRGEFIEDLYDLVAP